MPSAACPDLGPYTTQIAELSAALMEKEAAITALQGKVAQSDGHAQDLEKKLKDASQANTRIVEELATRDKERLKLAMDLSVAQGSSALKQRELADADAALRRAHANEKAGLTKARDAALKEFQASEASVHTLEQQLSQQNRKLATTSTELERANATRARLSSDLKDKNAELARRESELAMQEATITIATIGVVVVLPVLVLLAYAYLRLRHSREELELREGFLRVARGLRVSSGHSGLTAIEEALVGDLSGNRVLLMNLRRWLRVAISLSIIGAVTLACGAVFVFRNASLSAMHVDLIKSSAWQGLIGLFTPIGALIACVNLVQTKYKDAVSYCIAAGLVSPPPLLREAEPMRSPGNDEKKAA